MHRVAILLVCLGFLILPPAYGQNFEVKAVHRSPDEVVLHDRDTGEEWVATVGETVAGWRIVQITLDHVTIARKGDGGVVAVTQIPVGEGSRSGVARPEPPGQE
jgi:hypothetical protein